MFLIAAAFAGTEGIPQIEQAFAGRHRWRLEAQVLYRDDAPVLRQVLGPVAHVGDRVLAARIDEQPVHTVLVVIDGGGPPRTVDVPGDPTRVALSPDGAHAAWVSGHTGWASVYVASVEAPEPVQLTNTSVVRQKGARPLGFTAPPEDAMHFDGDHLVWSAEGLQVRVPWR